MRSSCHSVQLLRRGTVSDGVFADDRLIEHVGTALQHSRDMLVQRTLADQMRVQRGELGPEDAERRRLEAFEPGITHVDWGPNGEVLMPPLGADDA